MCPSSGEKTVFMRHLILAILCGWLSGMQVGMKLIPTCIPDSHRYRITSTKCRINIVVSPDDGHIVARNMQRKEINILRNIVHQVGFIYKTVQGWTSTKHKKPVFFKSWQLRVFDPITEFPRRWNSRFETCRTKLTTYMFNGCCFHFAGSDNIPKQKIQPYTC